MNRCFALVLPCLATALLTATSAAQNPQPAVPPSTQPDRPAPISDYVRRVFEDRAGHLWLGTNSDGLCRYDGKNLVYFGAKDGFPGRAVRAILQAPDDAMWFATDAGLSRFHLGTFTNYTVANGLPDDDCWSMLRDRTGTLWVGTMGGVCRLEGKSFVAFPLPAAAEAVAAPSSRFDPQLAFAMLEDRAGNLWFGTDGAGARKWDGKAFTTYTTKDGLADNGIWSLLEDRQGRIWLGTGAAGASCFDGKTFSNLTTKNGLGNERIWTMLEDRAGNLWFSTLGDGVSRYDGKTVTVLREQGGRTKNHVQSILQDRAGTMWFGFSGGLFRLAGNDFVHVTRDGPWR